ncbi:MAG: hypothetical protein IPP03_16030 [Dechloromonas sp.]|nr:hypothetical protein [Candidatus Dechloromonas phosphoritropha]MBP8787489.1 hypothetical protein [Azonexus sp.]
MTDISPRASRAPESRSLLAAEARDRMLAEVVPTITATGLPGSPNSQALPTL